MLSEHGKSNMVVGYDDLKEITGYEHPWKVAECLRNQGIKYAKGKNGRIWTTLGAIELGMCATVVHQETEKPKFTSALG